MNRFTISLVFSLVAVCFPAFVNGDIIFRASGNLELLPPGDSGAANDDVNGLDGALVEFEIVFAEETTAIRWPLIFGVAVFVADSAQVTITGAQNPASNGTFQAATPALFRPIHGDFGRAIGNVTTGPVIFAGTEFAVRVSNGFEDPTDSFGTMLDSVSPSFPDDVIGVDRFGAAAPAPILFSDFANNFADQSNYGVTNFITEAIDTGGDGCSSPNNFTPFRGLAIGNPATSDFADADGTTGAYNPGFTINNLEAPVWLIFDYATSAQGSVEITSSAGTPGLTMTVEYSNDGGASYTEIGSTDETFGSLTTESFSLNGVSADKIRVGWRRSGFTINFPWRVDVDAVLLCE